MTADTTDTGWWDRLYMPDGTLPDSPPAPAESSPAPARIPEWWKGEDALAAPAVEQLPDDDHADHIEGPADTDAEADDVADDSLPGRRERVRQHLALHASFDHRTVVLAYNGSAAGIGWGLGLVGAVHDALTDCGTSYSINGAVVLGVGLIALTAQGWDRRTRDWWPPLAWVARIPLASFVLALGLYAPLSVI